MSDEQSELGVPEVTTSVSGGVNRKTCHRERGMQKATARVLAAFMFVEADSVTAPELGERLQISSGSVSGRSRC